MSESDFMTTAIADAFRSKRLIYRAAEDNEADRTFVFRDLNSDHVTRALGDPSLHKSMNRVSSDKEFERQLNSTLLSIIVCLPGGDTQDPEPIGFLNIKEVPPYQRRGSMGIKIAPKHQNKGYGSEVVNWAMDWAFKWGGLHSLCLGASLYNERAVAVYEKAGFRREGVSKEAVYRNRRWWDTVQMAILEHEWEALRGINVPGSS
ncbi:acyl-CoA N-acyltransferase [Xylariaceae sp. FL1019]|nr:acyl-CoA N-acyltransferase [Xylariaceae sp. FL1019]